MKRIVAILIAMVMIVSLGACGNSKKEAKDVASSDTKTEETSSTDTADAKADKAKLHFVYVSPLLAHPIWLISKEGFEQACNELGIEGDWVGPQNISPEDMSKLIETAVAQKADAIITQGLVPAAPVQTAIDAGIPVLVVDSDIVDAD